MMKDDRERIRQAVDHTLSGLKDDPFLYTRVAAHAQEGENNMKKKTKLSLSLVPAMIAVLGVMAIAVAAGLSAGFVNWNGDFVPDEDRMVQPGPTPTPEAIGEAPAPLEEVLALSEAGEYEIVHVLEDHGLYRGGSHNGMYSSIADMDEFEQTMVAIDYLPVPRMIPEGYTFESGCFYYSCREGGAYQLLGQEEPIPGVTVSRYGLEESDRLISGYNLIFRQSDEDYHYLSIYVSLEYATDPDEHSFGLNEDQAAQVITVPGYDNALAVTGGRRCSIDLRRVLPEGIKFRYCDFMEINEVRTYSEVHVDVSAPLLSPDVAAGIFAE